MSHFLEKKEEEAYILKEKNLQFERNLSLIENLQKNIAFFSQKNHELEQENQNLKEMLDQKEKYKEELVIKMKNFYELERNNADLKRNQDENQGLFTENFKQTEVFKEKIQ